MQFDTREHQKLTLELIDKAPIQGNTSTVLPVLEQLLQFKQVVLSATIAETQAAAGPAEKPAPKKRTLREVETTEAPKTELTPAEEAGVEQLTTAPAATGVGSTEPTKRSWPARKPRGVA